MKKANDNNAKLMIFIYLFMVFNIYIMCKYKKIQLRTKKIFFTQILPNGMLLRGGNTSRKGQKDRNIADITMFGVMF